MKRRKDFTVIEVGTRFGRLTVVGEARRANGGRGYLCQCDCGGSTVQRPDYLLNGRTISCRCARTERVSKLNASHGDARVGKVTPEYKVWQRMQRRCYLPDDISFKNYGARGIKVCDRWLNSFENFLADMGRRPSRLHSIDRSDNDGNYEPGNCSWASKKAQARNCRSNIVVEYRGRKMCLAEAVELAGARYEMVRKRLVRGWSLDEALS